jgi:hypothetical protein
MVFLMFLYFLCAKKNRIFDFRSLRLSVLNFLAFVVKKDHQENIKAEGLNIRIFAQLIPT